jgi:hypothetical protein
VPYDEANRKAGCGKTARPVCPALILNEHGKVLACNSLANALSSYVQWWAFDRISLKDKAADQLLRDAIATIDMAGGPVRSFPVRDDATQAMMVAHVIQIRLSARDIFVRSAAALILTPVTARRGARRPQPRRRRNNRDHRLGPVAPSGLTGFT